MLAVLRTLGDVAPGLVAGLALIKVEPYRRCFLADGYEVGSHTISLDFEGLPIDLLPQLQLHLKMDLLATHHTVVQIIKGVVFESEGLVFGGCARRAVPAMGELERDQHSFVVLGPLHYRGDSGDASNQLPRELSKSLYLFIVDGMIGLVGGHTKGRHSLCHIVQSLVQ